MGWPWICLLQRHFWNGSVENVQVKSERMLKRVQKVVTYSWRESVECASIQLPPGSRPWTFQHPKVSPCSFVSWLHSLSWVQEGIILETSESFIILLFTFRLIINPEQICVCEMRCRFNSFFSLFGYSVVPVSFIKKPVSIALRNQLSVSRPWIYLSYYKETFLKFINLSRWLS